MSTTLPHGIIQINEGNIAWYGDITANWQLIDSKIGIYDAAIASIPAPANNGALTINYGGTTIAMFGADDAQNVTADIPAPGDGTLTVTRGGSTLGTFSANQATPETIDIPAPGDGTLTIQRNGTTIDTFTANASVDKTININTADDTKIPLAGSNAISGDLIPATTDSVNLGSSAKEYLNAYIKSLTINGVVCGDILTHNASEFVNVSSNQTIGGVKTFSDVIKNKNVQQFISNKEYNDTTDTWLDIHRYLDKNSTRIGFYAIGDFNGNRSFRWFVRGQSTNSVEVDIFGFGRKINETSYMYINATLETDLIPTINNFKSLGSSTNKWKSINGINPGALSLPSSTYIDIDTTNWDLTCQNELMGSFTPTADGWLMLHIANSGLSEVNFWVIGGVIRINNKSTLNTSDNNNFNMITIPVEKDVTYNIYGNASEYVAGRSIAYCRFMPCRGNV